jgi:hypothetical protein
MAHSQNRSPPSIPDFSDRRQANTRCPFFFGIDGLAGFSGGWFKLCTGLWLLLPAHERSHGGPEDLAGFRPLFGFGPRQMPGRFGIGEYFHKMFLI